MYMHSISFNEKVWEGQAEQRNMYSIYTHAALHTHVYVCVYMYIYIFLFRCLSSKCLDSKTAFIIKFIMTLPQIQVHHSESLGCSLCDSPILFFARCQRRCQRRRKRLECAKTFSSQRFPTKNFPNGSFSFPKGQHCAGGRVDIQKCSATAVAPSASRINLIPSWWWFEIWQIDVWMVCWILKLGPSTWNVAKDIIPISYTYTA